MANSHRKLESHASSPETFTSGLRWKVCGIWAKLTLAAILMGLLFAPKTVRAQGASENLNTGASKKKYWLGAEVSGMTPYPIPSKGLRIGSLLPQGSELELTYVKSDKDILLSKYSYSEIELRIMETTSSIIRWGYGLGQRSLKLDYEVFVEGSSIAVPINEVHQAINANFHFGIEFEILEHFSFGSDLFNLSYPIYWTKDSDQYPDSAQEFEEDPKGFPFFVSGFNLNMQFFRTYIAVKI